jgi:hypothetical protein
MSPIERNGIVSLQDDYPPGVPIEALHVNAACDTCAHRRLGTLGCDVFPDEIPLEIIRGKHDHRTPFPGDGGIQYMEGEPYRP